MVAYARLDFARVGAHTALVRRRFTWPFFVGRQLSAPDVPAAAVTTIQSASGTLNAGDRTTTALRVGKKAYAILRSQGAPSVHRSRDGHGVREATEIQVAERGRAELLAEPRVLFPGSRYEQITEIRTSAGACVIVGEGVIALTGASGESFAEYIARLRVHRDDRLLVDEVNSTGPWVSVPGAIARYTAIGSVTIIVDESFDMPVFDRGWSDGTRYVASTSLPNGAGHIVRIAAADGMQLRRTFSETVDRVRAAIDIQFDSSTTTEEVARPKGREPRGAPTRWEI